MSKEELQERMDQHSGYAYVYGVENNEREKNNEREENIFDMTPGNITNFIGSHVYITERIILRDMSDELILEAVCGGFIMSYPDQELCKEIIGYLAPI